MLYSHSPRSYVRTSNWKVDAKVSLDHEEWQVVDVVDIAAGGLLFQTEAEYTVGDSVHLDLYIDPLLPEIPEKLHMEMVARISSFREQSSEVNAYGVVFIKISLSDQVRLDELIRLTVTRYGSGQEPEA